MKKRDVLALQGPIETRQSIVKRGPRERRQHTHTFAVGSRRALCDVQWSSLAPVNPADPDAANEPPTCPRCLYLDPRTFDAH